MKILLRSTMVCSPADQIKKISENVYTLVDSGLGFESKEDTVIWNFVRDFVFANRHAPDFSTVKGHFERLRETHVVDRLQSLLSEQARTQGDFRLRIEEKSKDRKTAQFLSALTDAKAILTQGLEQKNGKESKFLRGPEDAASFIFQSLHSVVSPTFGSKLSGEITGDVKSYLDNYERTANDPLAGVGQFTGIAQIDQALSGAKKKELWVHAAFTGQFKSGFAFNWIYNTAVFYGHDALLFSLEMPYEQVQRILNTMHTFHPKFRQIRMDLGIQASPTVDVGLDYKLTREGRYAIGSPEHQLLVIAANDLAECSDYGKILIEEADPNKLDYTMDDLRSRAEVLHSQTPFGLLIIDHAGLLASRKRFASTTDAHNEVMRDAKKLAMSFNRGEGMAVVALFQINREGYKSALKAKEKTGIAQYNLTHLANCNEAEKSADIITATWIDDDMKKAMPNRIQFQNLKARDDQMFETFLARIEWPCRRLLTCYDALPVTPLQEQFTGSQSPYRKKGDSLPARLPKSPEAPSTVEMNLL